MTCLYIVYKMCRYFLLFIEFFYFTGTIKRAVTYWYPRFPQDLSGERQGCSPRCRSGWTRSRSIAWDSIAQSQSPWGAIHVRAPTLTGTIVRHAKSQRHRRGPGLRRRASQRLGPLHPAQSHQATAHQQSSHEPGPRACHSYHGLPKGNHIHGNGKRDPHFCRGCWRAYITQLGSCSGLEASGGCTTDDA